MDILSALLPFFVLLVVGALLLMYEVFAEEPDRGWIANLGSVGFLLAGFLLVGQLGDPSVGLFERGPVTAIMVDDFGRAASLVCVLAGLLATLFTPVYSRKAGHDHGEYYALIVFAVMGMMVMVMSGDLITFFVGLETMSVGVYCLTCLRSEDRRSSEAALKYFLMGAFATGFLLFGIAFIYGATASVGYGEIARSLRDPSGDGHLPILLLGILLVLIGFGFKVAAVPFHMWAPDTYEGAPTPVAGFMAAGVKAAAFVSLMRLVVGALPGLEAPDQMLWIPFLSGLAVLTILFGNLLALAQPSIKRMLAYSSVSHAGYLLIAVVAAAKGEASAPGALLYYLSGYTFMTLGAFGVLGILERIDGGPSSERYEAFAGVGHRHPALALAMALFMVAMGGLPPTAGFFGKLYVFSSAVRAGETWLALVGVFGSLISIVYYLRVLVAFYMREDSPAYSRALSFKPSPHAGIGLALAALGVVALGVWPGTWLDVTRAALGG
ncbi:MAG: NADH-quinone oxidoreductase subunit N [Myxococcota bacterium]